MNLEQKKFLLKKGIENGNFPKVLYKYRTIDQTKKILDNFSFWFARPDSFNDPFDCNLSEIENPSLDHARKHFRRLGIQENTVNKSIELYRRNPDKLVDLVKNTKEKSILSKGVLSLSKVFNNILMWSHYSENHTGIVIGLSMEADLDFFISPIKINYKDSYDPLNYLDNPEKSTIDTLRTKSSQWEYEHEIRIYKNSSKLYKIKENAINEIYFGIKASEKNIEDIRILCNSKGLNNISFYQGFQSHGAFEINFKKI